MQRPPKMPAPMRRRRIPKIENPPRSDMEVRNDYAPPGISFEPKLSALKNLRMALKGKQKRR